nr:MAG TPA: hypothetical protein [Bacteriophage sp.]
MQTQPFPEIFTLIGFLPVSLRRHLNGEKGEHRLPFSFCFTYLPAR